MPKLEIVEGDKPVGRLRSWYTIPPLCRLDRNCHYGTPLTLEKHCWRDVKAVAEPFYLLSVELTLLFQNQGHNTLAAQILCKILLSKSVRIHQFLQHFDARNLFDGEMLRFVVRDQNDEQFGRFRLFRSSMCFALQFQKPGNIDFVLLSRRNGLRSLFFDEVLCWQAFSNCRHFSTLLCRNLCGSTPPTR